MESWRDHTGTSQRTHIHGPIQSLAVERPEGESSVLKATLYGSVFILAGVLALVAFT